jgi:tyrosyl-tRNA synthetase
MGGATGAIGDPSGRSTERNILTNDVLTTNIQGIEAQVRRFFECGARLAKKRQEEHNLNTADESDRVKVLNNASWLDSMSTLTFLGEVGRYMRVGSMLARDR